MLKITFPTKFLLIRPADYDKHSNSVIEQSQYLLTFGMSYVFQEQEDGLGGRQVILFTSANGNMLVLTAAAPTSGHTSSDIT